MNKLLPISVFDSTEDLNQHISAFMNKYLGWSITQQNPPESFPAQAYVVHNTSIKNVELHFTKM